jgi:predicted nucleic acid-binding protein
LPKYFLDTSALAKLYHVETGSEYMDRILGESGSQFIISRLSILEMESVLATKVRTREIDKTGAEIARRCLRADLMQGRLAVGPPILTHHYEAARVLLVKFGATEGLRTLDALQLAVALDLKQLGRVTVLVTADQRLCRVAPLASCPAINPEKPESVLL